MPLSGPDKFLRTDLEKIIKDKGITTVIVTGTASNGAVLYTGSGAAFRGLNVIVPVDGLSAVDAYADYSTVFTFLNAPLLSAKTTLTKRDMIKFWSSFRACGGGSHTFPSARRILSGVNGMSVRGFAPSGRSASLIAFMMDAGAPAVPASPAPLAPSSLSAVGETTCPHSMSGISAAIGTR